MSNKFKMMLLAMATLGVVGCADKLTDDVVQSPEDIGGETGYLSFRIKSADTGGMTRAIGDAWLDDDTEDGDYAEGAGAFGNFAGEDDIVNNVQANRVFFFDNNGKYHSSALLTLETGTGSHENNHGTTYPEAVYSTTVKRTSDRGELNWPTKFLVVLNGRPSRLNALTVKAQEETNFDMDAFLSWVNEDLRDTDAEAEGETLGLYKYGEKYYFTMTNSIYLNDTDDEILNATQITEGKMKKTREEAAADPVVAYVERIMSKVEVVFTGYSEAGNEPGYFTTTADEVGTPFGFFYDFTDTKEGNATWIDDASEDVQSPVMLKGLITNWTINAVEYQTKLFKDLDIVTATEKTNTPVTTAWTKQAGPFSGWNDFTHHRSYWAIDPHYNFSEAEYPTQFRQSYMGDVRPYQPQTDWTYGQPEEEEGGNDIFKTGYPWALDYKSFNAVVNKRRYKYCLENTFGLTANDQEGYKHMIMGSHVLIQARLLTSTEADNLKKADGEDGKITLDDISDKYYFSDSYYDEATYINSRVTRINQVLGENVGDLTVENLNMFPEDTDASEEKYTYQHIAGGLWVKGDNNTYKKVVASVNNENNEIAATDVFVIAPAYVPKGDGKVTIALGTKDTDGKNVYGYDSEDVNLYYFPKNTVDENGQPTKEEDNVPAQFTRNQLVSLIYQVANTADCFKGGRMYYTIPIQHHLAGTATGENAGNYEYKYIGLNTADYGVVRNHWYKFTVKEILKPGIPVHDPTQPIIPNYDEEDRYIGLEVVILPWHIVDNGNVTLGK